MSWKQWIALAVALGGGIALLVPGQTGVKSDGGPSEPGAAGEAATAEAPSSLRTVALDVTGMT